MAKAVGALDPLINSEIHRYSGPKTLLRSRARVIAVNAIKSYNPDSGAHLRSWVTTQLQPLSRYGQQLRPVHAPEVAIRQAAEVARVGSEMSDELGRDPTDDELADAIGISVKRVQAVRRMVRPSVTEGALSAPEGADDDSGSAGPAVTMSDAVGPAEDAVYMSLSKRDQLIFDWRTGKHGKPVMRNAEIAKRLGISAAAVSQRTQGIADQIRDVVDRGLM